MLRIEKLHVYLGKFYNVSEICNGIFLLPFDNGTVAAITEDKGDIYCKLLGRTTRKIFEEIIEDIESDSKFFEHRIYIMAEQEMWRTNEDEVIKEIISLIDEKSWVTLNTDLYTYDGAVKSGKRFRYKTWSKYVYEDAAIQLIEEIKKEYPRFAEKKDVKWWEIELVNTDLVENVYNRVCKEYRTTSIEKTSFLVALNENSAIAFFQIDENLYSAILGINSDKICDKVANIIDCNKLDYALEYLEGKKIFHITDINKSVNIIKLALDNK